MFIPDYIKKITDILYDAGEEAYLVGGCVRDSIMGKTPNDYDIAVSCEPKRTEELLDGFRVFETGIKHGTVTVVANGNNVELTTFRVDGEYLDNRRPENVFFTRSITDDLARRDFTVNAIAYSEKVGFTDPFGGKDDIKKEIIRCVGSPDKRFNEDSLRIVRGMRFSSVLGFSVDEKTADSMIKNRGLLENIAGERIFVEMKKLLVGKNNVEVLLSFDSVMCQVFPELELLSPVDRHKSYKRILGADCPETAFAAVFYNLPKEKTEDALRRMKTDNAFRSSVLRLIMSCREYEEKSREQGNGDREKTAYMRLFTGKYGKNAAIKLVDMLRRTNGGDDTAVRFVENGFEGAISQDKLSVNGSDMKKLGIDGAAIGKMLDRLTQLVALGELENQKDALLAFTRQTIIKE